MRISVALIVPFALIWNEIHMAARGRSGLFGIFYPNDLIPTIYKSVFSFALSWDGLTAMLFLAVPIWIVGALCARKLVKTPAPTHE